MVFVNKPVNISDASQVKIMINNGKKTVNNSEFLPFKISRLHSLVADFESLPSSVGRFSTKFWLRDYEQFSRENSGDPSKEAIDDLVAFEGVPVFDKNKNELR